MTLLINDLLLVIQWWSMFLIIGLLSLPLTTRIFTNFFDKGYIFSKTIGFLILSYAVFLLGTFHVLPFTRVTIFILLSVAFTVNLVLILKNKNIKQNIISLKPRLFFFFFEEILFFLALLFWSYIKAYQPEIHGLEKYMDFGFMNSILRSEYFPAKDMWLTPFTINYYYFGHIIGAVLTKLSSIPSYFSYNLILATIFSLCFTSSFSIGANLIYKIKNKKTPLRWVKIFGAGMLSAILVTLGGNLHALYTLFQPYQNENPKPFWDLVFSPQTFPNSYWYPNATRFIYNTIHEFPSYSFVVSDLHGHVFSIPIVLTTIALLFSFFLAFEKKNLILLGFLLACAYMTNAWDGIIYLLLSSLVILFSSLNSKSQTKLDRSIMYQVLSIKAKKEYIIRNTYYILLIFIFFILFSLPFSIYFKPFVSGVGILCAPEFLTKIGKLGPFLFEANHCQHSPWWQLLILYGFFYFWVSLFIGFTIYNMRVKQQALSVSDKFMLVLIALSTLLIIIPEFIYMKDIYPAHYRANTMFKLVYQSFIMLSLVSSYAIITIIPQLRFKITNIKSYWKVILLLIGGASLFLVLIYPNFSIESYFSKLSQYHGLDGISYLQRQYPTDYKAIIWIQKNISGQPVILEAQGDSYTDYARVSANTGLPTVLGWTVHEWLWRGTYDIPAPRIDEVKALYETKDVQTAKKIVKKYNIQYIFIGALEKEKYPLLSEEVFVKLGKPIYINGATKIYKTN